MAKKKTKKLEFLPRFLNSVIHGNIKGIELPKTFGEFTDSEKKALYWNNPKKAGSFFKDISFVGEFTEIPDAEKPDTEIPDTAKPPLQIKEFTDKE